MDDRMLAKLARSFAATTGIDYEDLLQEARMAVWEAADKYDPRIAAWSTFSTTCAMRHLCGVATDYKRRHPAHEELQDWVPSREPSPEDRAVFLEMLAQLPEDAGVVVRLALSEARELAGMTPARVRRVVGATLSWPTDRVDAAIAAVVRVLRGGPMVRRT